jgi:hypothetical protein
MTASSRLLVAVTLLALLEPLGLAAQANHNFAAWEPAISAFERADATNPPPKGGIEFIGSSTIARWKTLARDFPGQPVFNRGFGGSEIVDSTHFANRIVFPYAPAKIFFRAGGNDLWAGKSPDQVFADFQDFATLVHARLPATEIYFIGWSPTPARWKQHQVERRLNDLVIDFAQDKSWLRYINTYDLPLNVFGWPRPGLFVADRLHFNDAGYRLLAARLRPFVAGSSLGATGGPAK